MNKLLEVLSGIKPEVGFVKPTIPTAAVNRCFSMFYIDGIPRAGDFPSSDTGSGIALTSPIKGAMSFANAGPGLYNYLAGMIIQGSTRGLWVLCDRLWHNKIQNTTTTSQQTINSVAFPARDNNQSINGYGVSVGLEVGPNFTVSAANRTLTIGYTNPTDDDGKFATFVCTTQSSYPLGAFMPFSTTELGVKSIQTYQQSSSLGGGGYNVSLVAYRTIASILVGDTNDLVPRSLNLVNGGLPKVLNESVLFLLFFPFNTASIHTLHGSLTRCVL